MAKASKKFQPVTESELLTIVQKHAESSVLYYSSKLSEERKNVMEYYHGEKPRPAHAGNSKYVSMDVFDAVESLKAVLLETFSAGNRIVSFDPQTDKDVDAMRVATEYADYVVHRQNDSYNVFSSVIQDGLMARTGIVKVFWDERFEEQEEEFHNVTAEAAELLLSQDDVTDLKLEHNEDSGLFDGTLMRRIDKSQVRYVPVAPEEFLITETAPSLSDAPFVAHRTRKTRTELIEMGYPKDLVYSINDSEGNDELAMDPERLARFEDIGAGLIDLGEEEQQLQTRHVMVYECYMPLDMDGSGEAKLWKVVMAGRTILEKELVDKRPFLSFTPIPLPHTFYGSNYAARVIPTQNARTVLMRGILDHTVITNNPRMMVVKGAVMNPKELLENRVGGLVNVTRPDGIAPLPQAGLNPFVFQTIQLLDEDKEEVTGVSRLSQGLNKDAISQQNSQAMVQDMVSLSQQREKIIARNFANQFVKELYLEVYRLVLLNEKQTKIVRLAGEFVQVDPQEWTDQVTCTVEMKLGYNEQQQDAMKYIAINAQLGGDPQNGRIYSEQNRYAVFRTALEKAGIKQISQYLTDPSTLPAPQPDPFKVQEMQLEARKVAVQESVAKTTQQKVADHMQVEQMKIMLEKQQAQIDALLQNRQIDVKQFVAASTAAMKEHELKLVEKEMEQNPPQTQAVAKV
ncbi:portal protein [Burkholderia sp. DN3021]|uniref:portal protein n=1 Tax=Burkholderia sp. DN3021 TaxID=3410137 RepID=UPI003C7DECFD